MMSHKTIKGAVLFTTALASMGANAQDWQRQSPTPYPPNLTFPTIELGSELGFNSTDGGLIRITRDSGRTWNLFPFSGNFDGSFILDDQHAWVLAGPDTRRTTDGGKTWTRIPTFIGSNDVTFITPQDGWANTNGQLSFFTHDGGETWTPPVETGGLLFGSGVLASPNLAFRISPSDFGVDRSTDGGVTWSTVQTTTQETTAVTPFSEQVILAAARGEQILRSTDGGQTWASVGPTIASSSGNTPKITKVSDTRAIVWFQAMGVLNNTLHVTADAGATWTTTELPTQPSQKIYPVGGSRVIAWSAATSFVPLPLRDTIYLSEDGGLTWAATDHPDFVFLRDVDFSTDNRGLALTNSNVWLETTDGGHTWDYFSEGAMGAWESIEMWDDQRGITVGRNINANRILITDNAGANWTPLFPANAGTIFALNDVTLLDGGLAFAGGEEQTIIKSEDFGQNWTDISAGLPVVPASTRDIFAIDFVSEQKGWAAGGFEGSILHTSDGGQSWSHQITPSQGFIVLSIDMFDDQLGLAGGTGATLWRTENGGTTWNLIPIPNEPFPNETNITAIGFASEDVAWIAGEFGYVAHTEDGGVTWTRQDAGVPAGGGPGVFNTLRDIHVVSEQEAYLVFGIEDTILHTTDGGQTWDQIQGLILPDMAALGRDDFFLLSIEVVGDRIWATGEGGGIVMLDRSCPADLTSDGTLDFFDISDFLAAFGSSDPAADFNDDGNIDFFDVSDYLQAFNAGCP